MDHFLSLGKDPKWNDLMYLFLKQFIGDNLTKFLQINQSHYERGIPFSNRFRKWYTQAGINLTEEQYLTMFRTRLNKIYQKQLKKL